MVFVKYLSAGDQVLEWNGTLLQGATFKEVYNIILESKPEAQVELVVSRPIGWDIGTARACSLEERLDHQPHGGLPRSGTWRALQSKKPGCCQLILCDLYVSWDHTAWPRGIQTLLKWKHLNVCVIKAFQHMFHKWNIWGLKWYLPSFSGYKLMICSLIEYDQKYCRWFLIPIFRRDFRGEAGIRADWCGLGWVVVGGRGGGPGGWAFIIKSPAGRAQCAVGPSSAAY